VRAPRSQAASPARRRPGLFVSRCEFRRRLVGRIAYRYFLWRVLRQVRGQGIGHKPAALARDDFQHNLDTTAALLDPGPWLLGYGPYLCDFALLGELVYLQRTPAGGPMIAERPAIGAFLDRMRELRESRGAKKGSQASFGSLAPV